MIELAFAKDKTNERKLWLQEPYDESFQCDFSKPFLPMEEWFTREYIHHPHYNCRRAIPYLMDGFKDVQRKILYTAIVTKASTEEVKVTQLAGATSEKADYHHGETSCEVAFDFGHSLTVQSAIVHLAQRFVGSNNVNLLEPSGQFGTRLGNDVGASRYATLLFNLTISDTSSLDCPQSVDACFARTTTMLSSTERPIKDTLLR